MNLEIGWYKVKLEGEWDCAYFDGTDFSVFALDDDPTWLNAEEFDQIGDKIEFPNE